MFALDPPTPNADIHQYLSISPGEKISSELTIPFDLEPGEYNICAEVLILGEHEIVNQKPTICVPITYQQ